MRKEEFNTRITDIGKLDDVAEIREQLTQLSETMNPEFDRYSELESENNTLKTDNESLRSANYKLFLRVGEQKTPEEIIKSKTGMDKDPEPVKRSFENLFDEKGRLK